MSTVVEGSPTSRAQHGYEHNEETQCSFVAELGIAASNAAMWLLETVTDRLPSRGVRDAPFHDEDLDQPDRGM